MANFDYRINDKMRVITVNLPILMDDSAKYIKIMKDVSKLVNYCNSETDTKVDTVIHQCEHCKKTFKRVNGKTVHMKTCIYGLKFIDDDEKHEG